MIHMTMILMNMKWKIHNRNLIHIQEIRKEEIVKVKAKIKIKIKIATEKAKVIATIVIMK